MPTRPCVGPSTVAKSLAIGNPTDGDRVLDTVRATGGAVDQVNDTEILDAISLLARTEGVFAETAGGVTVGVLAKLAAAGVVTQPGAGRGDHFRQRAQDRRNGGAPPADTDQPSSRHWGPCSTPGIGESGSPDIFEGTAGTPGGLLELALEHREC